MTPEQFIAKAEQSASSARLLFEAGDMDGASDRAYFSIFSAARAALLASSAPVHAEVARTHSGLISAFSLHLVKPGILPVELGRAFNKALEIRQVADYRGDPVAPDKAEWILRQAESFLATVKSTLLQE